MAHLDLVALIVKDYDPAIDFFVRVLGFELIEDVAVDDERWAAKTLGGGAARRRNDRHSARPCRW